MIVERSKDHFEAHVEGCPVKGPFKTLQQAEKAYVSEMANRGETIDSRTLMVFRYMPNEPVYKLLRIR